MRLTKFQSRVLDAIERGPNQMADWWEVAWNGFPREWESKRSSHGVLITNIQRAARALEELGIVVILPPKDEWSSAVYCSHRRPNPACNRPAASGASDDLSDIVAAGG